MLKNKKKVKKTKYKIQKKNIEQHGKKSLKKILYIVLSIFFTLRIAGLVLMSRSRKAKTS